MNTVEDVTRLGYTVIVRRMARVPFGVILRKASRYEHKTIAVYAAGETVSDAITRALAKIAGRMLA